MRFEPGGLCVQGPSILGEIAWRRGNPRAALSICREALSTEPDMAHMHLNCAALLRELEDDGTAEAALEHLRAALILNPYLTDPLIYATGEPHSLFAPQDVLLSCVRTFEDEVAFCISQMGLGRMENAWHEAWAAGYRGNVASLTAATKEVFGSE